MKQMKYLSVQGWYAPSFWFKNHDAHNFKSLIESITLSHTLVISSIYRTDVFYHSEEDLSDLLLKVWCTFKEADYGSIIKNRFIRASGKEGTYETYFNTLFHLMLHPHYYERYKQRLHEIQLQDKNNQTLQDLMKCDLHLEQCYKNKNVKYHRLSSLETTYLPKPIIVEDFQALARQHQQEFINN